MTLSYYGRSEGHAPARWLTMLLVAMLILTPHFAWGQGKTSKEAERLTAQGQELLKKGDSVALPAAADQSVVLGSTERVTNLFSYPNCQQSCPSNPTLEETVTYYIRQSMRRDGLVDSSVVISKQGDVYNATFSGAAAAVYPAAIDGFSAAGDLAYAGAQKLKDDNKWQPGWRFFLPLGLAWTKHPTVEILHFPPDYVLTRDQDYMKAKTTQRWTHLLSHNGLTADDAIRDQAIVDIAPIAAPADSGSTLEGVYSYFYDYQMSLLRLWIANADGQSPKPVVAFGGPIRAWIKQNFSANLNVAQTGVLPIDGFGNVQIVGSNHPSFIFYVVTRPGDSDAKRFANGMKIMQQDAIVACWQSRMGQTAGADPTSVLSTCTTRWAADKEGLCQLLETEAYGRSEDDAAQYCRSGVLQSFEFPTDAEMESLRATAPLTLQ